MTSYIIIAGSNVSPNLLRKALGLYCSELYFLFASETGSNFLAFIKELDVDAISEKLEKIDIMGIEECFDSDFHFDSQTIFVDSSIPNLENIVQNVFIGGYTFDLSADKNMYRIIGSRQEDVYHLACYLKFSKKSFSDKIQNFPLILIQNLPLNFSEAKLQQIFQTHLKYQINRMKLITKEQSTIAIVLLETTKIATDASQFLSNGIIQNRQLAARFLYEENDTQQFRAPQSMPQAANESAFRPSPMQQAANESAFRQSPMPQAANEFAFRQSPMQQRGNEYAQPNSNYNTSSNLTPSLFNSFNPNMPVLGSNPQRQFLTVPNYLPSPDAFPTQDAAPKKVIIYPNSFVRSIIIGSPGKKLSSILEAEIRKYGIVERVTQISKEGSSSLFQVVYAKEGSKNTALNSSLLSHIAHVPDFRVSTQPISPVFQYYPQDDYEPKESFSSDPFAVIIALDIYESFNKVQSKLQSFGEYTMIWYQGYEDRVEYEVFFKMCGSMATLLNCKEFKTSAAPASELLAYRKYQQQINSGGGGD